MSASEPTEGARVPLRTAVLKKADTIINGDRQATYGDAQESFDRIAAIWTVTVSGKLKPGESITAHDVALMMVGMKISRSTGAVHVDNYVDMAGYAGLAAELSGAAPESV